MMIRVLLFLSLAAFALGTDVGEDCLKNDECSFGDNTECYRVSGCTYGQCRCKEDYYYQSTSTSCVKITDRALGESCDLTVNICEPDYSSCDTTGSNTCKCPNGMTENGGKCEFGSKLIGDTATYATECKAYAYYEERKTAGKAPESGTTTVTITSGKCACSTNYQANSGNDQCVSSRKAFGEACNTVADCDTDTYLNIACVSGACNCGTDTVKNSETLYNVYNYYEKEKACVPTNSLFNQGKKQICGATYATIHAPAIGASYCAKGLTCGQCPGADIDTCMSGATTFGISVMLLLSAFLAQKMF